MTDQNNTLSMYEACRVCDTDLGKLSHPPEDYLVCNSCYEARSIKISTFATRNVVVIQEPKPIVLIGNGSISLNEDLLQENDGHALDEPIAYLKSKRHYDKKLLDLTSDEYPQAKDVKRQAINGYTFAIRMLEAAKKLNQ